jgi:hypothetical protein
MHSKDINLFVLFGQEKKENIFLTGLQSYQNIVYTVMFLSDN